jgi:pyruvate carboxylase
LGLTEKWPEIKRKYAEANIVLGDIPKVTPSSKVVGDLAQFMVAQELEPQDILDQAETLAFPDSVVNYLRGDIGIPPGGFPEPLRSKVLASRGLDAVNGRPGAFLKSYDFDEEREALESKYGKKYITEKDLLSYALYPEVFKEWKEFEAVYGEVEGLPTNLFLNPMKVGQEVELDLGPGRSKSVKLVSMSDVNEDGTRMVLFEVNGEQMFMPVTDHSVESEGSVREKAGAPGTVGSPMPGVVVGVKVKAGDIIKEGDTVATLSAMKMETSIPATVSGTVTRVTVNVGDKVEGDDLLVEIDENLEP